jgi:hypothetical protein
LQLFYYHSEKNIFGSLDILVAKEVIWEDNIKVDVREIGCGGMNGAYLAQDRNQWRTPVNMVIVGKFSSD